MSFDEGKERVNNSLFPLISPQSLSEQPDALLIAVWRFSFNALNYMHAHAMVMAPGLLLAINIYVLVFLREHTLRVCSRRA